MKKTLFLLVLITLPLAAFAQTSNNFVSLTALPGLTTVTNNSTNFIPLFNNLYKVCIGVAGALAFIEIVWAGVTWMTAGDNAEQVGQARKRIGNAVLGLVLVLSPVIVFGIINPNVLSLTLNVSGLAPDSPTGSVSASPGTTATNGNNAVNPNAAPGTPGAACTTNNDCNGDTVCNDATGACEADGPNVYSCADDSATNPQTGMCANGQPPANVNGDEAPANGAVQPGGSCAGNEDACTNGNICNDQTSTCSAIPAGGSVGQNGSCAGNVNACTNGLTCDDDTDTCITATADEGAGASQTVVCPSNTDNAGQTVDDLSECSGEGDDNGD